MAGKKGDVMVAVEPRPDLVQMFEEFGGSVKPRVGQIGADHQKPFFAWAEKELLPALREL